MRLRSSKELACEEENPITRVGKRKRIIIFLVALLFFLLNFQVNVVSYKTRPAAKDFIQVEIVVEKNSQKIIVIGKVSN